MYSNSLSKKVTKKIILLALCLFVVPSQAKLVERVVAIVADEIITLSDLNEYRKKLKNKGLRDETLLRLRKIPTLLADQKALTNHLIDERILDTVIKKRGLSVTIERIEKEIRTIASRNGMSRNQLKASLVSQGVSMAQYQDFVKQSLERQSLIEQEVSSKVKISDDDILSYLVTREGKTNLRNYQFTLSHILFRSAKGGAEAAMARAKSAQSRVRSDNFKELVEQLTEDPNFTDNGKLGKFNQSELSPQFRKAVIALDEGEISDIVQTNMGYHILKVEKKTLVSNPELAARKDDVKKILFAEGFNRQLLTFLDTKRKELFIRVN